VAQPPNDTLRAARGRFLFLPEDADASSVLEKTARCIANYSEHPETVVLWADRAGIAGGLLAFNSEGSLEDDTVAGYEEFGLHISAGTQLSYDEHE
jgi:hypothetical protein